MALSSMGSTLEISWGGLPISGAEAEARVREASVTGRVRSCETRIEIVEREQLRKRDSCGRG